MKKRLVSLKSIVYIKNGFAFKSSDYTDSGLRVIRITNVQKGMIIDSNPQFVSESTIEEAKEYLLYSGDILISLTGNVGRVGILPKEFEPAVLNQRVACIRIKDKEIVDQKYLFFYLNSNTFERECIKNSNGIAQLNLSSRWLENYKIPLQPIEDQIRIATVLSRAETLIAKRKESIKALDELLKSTFLEMFGPQNKDFCSWPVVELKDLAADHKGSIRTGPFGSNLLHSEFTKSGDVAVLGIDNAVQNKFTWGERRYITIKKYTQLSSYRIYPGDVIITIMGTIGRSAVIPNNIPLAINTKHLAAITFNRQKANPQFISYSIHSDPNIIKQLIHKNRGAIMNGLNLGLIKGIKLRKPPIELQNKFAAIFDKIEVIKAKYQTSLTELENLYGSLSQRAFKGELDLSKVPIDVEIKPESAKVKIEILEPKLEMANKFSQDKLKSIIKKQSKNQFGFNDLWKTLQDENFEKPPTYEDVKKMVFGFLSSDKPFLIQEFDDRTQDSEGKPLREIVLRVNV